VSDGLAVHDECTRMYAFHTLEDAVLWALMTQHLMLHCAWPAALQELECTRTVWCARAQGRPWRKLFDGMRMTVAINEQRFTNIAFDRVRRANAGPTLPFPRPCSRRSLFCFCHIPA
jgi:hypothetical protein